MTPIAFAASSRPREKAATILDVKIESFFYGRTAALRKVHLEIPKNRITAFIGPSGCGKSTTLRCLNRMHPQNRTRLVGQILFRQPGPLWHAEVDPRLVRVHIGMVFQQPNPFQHLGFRERRLRITPQWLSRQHRAEGRGTRFASAALWDDVKDRLKQSGTDALRGPATAPLHRPRHGRGATQVLLMDEPCSALDPISTGKIEDLILELKQRDSASLSSRTISARPPASRIDLAYFYVERDKHSRYGRLHEFGPTRELVENPKSDSLRAYLAGKIG